MSVAWSFGVQLVGFFCSGNSVLLFHTLGSPGVTERFCRVLVSDSSKALFVIYLFPMLIHSWIRKPSCGPNVLNHCISKGQGFGSSKTGLSPPSNLLMIVLRRHFCCGSSILCMYVYGLQQYGQLNNIYPLFCLFCSVL